MRRVISFSFFSFSLSYTLENSLNICFYSNKVSIKIMQQVLLKCLSFEKPLNHLVTNLFGNVTGIKCIVAYMASSRNIYDAFSSLVSIFVFLFCAPCITSWLIHEKTHQIRRIGAFKKSFILFFLTKSPFF